MSAADQIKALVEAAEHDAEQARASVARIAEHADAMEQRLDAVDDAVAALREELKALRQLAVRAPQDAVDEELIAEAEKVAAREPEVAQEEEPVAGEPVPEGARLLALKMALDGRPRAETAAYLSENFELSDSEALLDEVYSRAEGRN